MKLKRFALRCGKCRKYVGYADVTKKPIVYCNERCKNATSVASARVSDFELVDANLSCGTKGAFAELLTAAILLSRGYDVYRSVSPNANCDLVIVRGKLVLRIEVRSGKYNGRSLKYAKKDQDNADFYAVYHIRDDKPQIAFIRVRKSPKGKVNFAKPAVAMELAKGGTKKFPVVSY